MGRHANRRTPALSDPPEEAQQVEHAADPTPTLPDGVNWHFANEHRSFGDMLLVYQYRHAARRVFRQLKHNGHEEIQTVTFGHTHLPDRYIFPGDLVYINSGDWCGNTPHQCYSVIQSDGSVRGPFQWNGPRTAVFATAPPKSAEAAGQGVAQEGQDGVAV